MFLKTRLIKKSGTIARPALFAHVNCLTVRLIPARARAGAAEAEAAAPDTHPSPKSPIHPGTSALQAAVAAAEAEAAGVAAPSAVP